MTGAFRRLAVISAIALGSASSACAGDGRPAAVSVPVPTAPAADATVPPAADALPPTTVTTVLDQGSSAPCPPLIQASVAFTVDDAGAEPRAVRAFGGEAVQAVTLRSAVDARIEQAGSGGAERHEEEIDLRVVRGAAAGSVAPVQVVVVAARAGEAVIGPQVQTAPQRTALAPAAGSAICLLQGVNGLRSVNSSTAAWGPDGLGVLQSLLAAQVVLFPAEPIGVGARWSRQERIDHDGRPEVRRWSYELVAVDEHTYDVHGTASGELIAVDLSTERSVPERGADLVMRRSAEFSVQGRFDRPLATSAEIVELSEQRSESLGLTGSGTRTLQLSST